MVMLWTFNPESRVQVPGDLPSPKPPWSSGYLASLSRRRTRVRAPLGVRKEMCLRGLKERLAKPSLGNQPEVRILPSPPFPIRTTGSTPDSGSGNRGSNPRWGAKCFGCGHAFKYQAGTGRPSFGA